MLHYRSLYFTSVTYPASYSIEDLVNSLHAHYTTITGLKVAVRFTSMTSKRITGSSLSSSEAHEITESEESE